MPRTRKYKDLKEVVAIKLTSTHRKRLEKQHGSVSAYVDKCIERDGIVEEDDYEKFRSKKSA